MVRLLLNAQVEVAMDVFHRVFSVPAESQKVNLLYNHLSSLGLILIKAVLQYWCSVLYFATMSRVEQD
jgi:hypothetical protein